MFVTVSSDVSSLTASSARWSGTRICRCSTREVSQTRHADGGSRGAPTAPVTSELAQPDEAHRVVGRLAQHESGAAPGGLDVLLEVRAVDGVPDPVGLRD